MTRTAARHTWVPYVAALAGLILVLKVTLVVASNNEALDGPMGPVSHLGGVGLGVVAAIGVGLRASGGVARRIAFGFGAVLFLIAWVMGFGDLVEPAIGVFSDAEHVKDEVPIGIAGLGLLAGAYVGYSHDQDVVPAGAPAPTAA
ncbi:MAG TPA: hypothetical protein VNB94_11875 [Mycobacteriales bacterium]|nr:hypothetical protein [Mycobacteriales bacterium]